MIIEKSPTVNPIPNENIMNARAIGKTTSIITLPSSSTTSSSAITDPVTKNNAKIAGTRVRMTNLITPNCGIVLKYLGAHNPDRHTK